MEWFDGFGGLFCGINRYLDGRAKLSVWLSGGGRLSCWAVGYVIQSLRLAAAQSSGLLISAASLKRIVSVR